MKAARTILATAALGAAALLLAVTAQASPPQPAAGTATVAIFPTSVRTADGNTILDGVVTGTFTGTIAGTVTESFHWVIHSDGQGEFHGTGVLVGSIDGCGAGTFPFHTNAFGSLAAYTGRSNTIDEAANTTGAHYNITFVGSGLTLSYTGTYDCG